MKEDTHAKPLYFCNFATNVYINKFDSQLVKLPDISQLHPCKTILAAYERPNIVSCKNSKHISAVNEISLSSLAKGKRAWHERDQDVVYTTARN